MEREALERWLGRPWAWLLVCAVFIAARAPLLLLEPRLRAEEASVYLAYANSHGFLSSLLLIPTSDWPAGYLNLPANLAATLAAFLFPLEWAPAVATSIAFALQLLPFALVLWGRSRFWSTPGRRVACCLVLLFAPAVRPEVWLTVINSQVFCGIAALILLFEDLDGANRRRIWVYRLLLLFCGLSGVYASLLAIPFFVRARYERSRESLVQFAILASTAALQLAAYSVTVTQFSIAPDRGLAAPWVVMIAPAVALDHLLLPVFGRDLVSLLIRLLGLQAGIRANGWSTSGFLLLNVVSIGSLIAAGWWLGRRRQDRSYRLFAVAFITLAATTSVLGYGLPRGRYSVLSGLVFLLALLVGSWCEEAPGRRRMACRVLVGIALVIGSSTFWLDESTPRQGARLSRFGYAPGRPDWRQEMARWRRDPRYQLRVWPYTETESWRTPLTGFGEFQEIRSALDGVTSFHLIASPDQAQERRIPLPGLPADFKMVVAGTSSHPRADVKVEAVFEDASQATVASTSIGGLGDRHGFTALVTPPGLRLEPGRALGHARSLTLRAESRSPSTVVVAIDRVEIAPRIEGLLDGLLPTKTLPTRLYHASPVRPLAQEATAVLALESLLHDRDLYYSQKDAARAHRRWRNGPLGLELSGAEYDESLPYLLAALPFAALAGPSGQVALNLILFSTMVTFAWQDRRPTGLPGSCFAAGALFAAAGFGYVLLPQSQVFEMFCLFVPVRLWIRGQLEAGSSTAPKLLSGALLAIAALQEPVWGLLLLLMAGDLVSARRWRAPVPLLGGATVLIVSLTLAAHYLPLGAPEAAPPPLPAESEVGTTTDDPGFARNAWELFVARRGLLAGYPFAVAALALFARGGEDRRHLLLFAALLAITCWIAWKGLPTTRGSPLGSPHFAAIYPLFLLLPGRIESWRWLLVPAAAALLLTLGVTSSAWAS